MPNSTSKPTARFNLSEDWLSVVIALILILLSAIGLLGPNGIKIIF